MPQIFISYFREEGEQQARQIKEYIEQELQGVNCWIDKDDMRSGEWRKNIDAQLQASEALVLIVTANSLTREWVNYEWIFALGAGKKVIPAVFENPEEYYERLKDENWRFFTEDKRPEWDELLEDLRAILGNLKRRIVAPADASQFIKKVVDDLEGPDSERWENAIGVLRDSDDPDALRILKQVAERFHTPRIKYLAAFACVERTKYQDYDAVVWDTFREVSTAEPTEIRRQAWGMLSEIGGSDSIEILFHALLKEDHSLLRIEIITRIGRAGRNGDDLATERLAMYYHQTRDGQKAIIDALGQVGTPLAVETLVKYYAEAVKGTRKQIVNVLGIIDTAESSLALVHLLRGEEDMSIQYEIIQRLPNNLTEEAISRLEEIVNSSPPILRDKMLWETKLALQNMKRRKSE